MTIEIILPEMGEGVIEGTLVRWLVAEGDEIEAFAPLAEVETDKVTTEITSETAGRVLRLRVAEGETVAVETVLAEISGADEPEAVTVPQQESAQVEKQNGQNGRAPAPAASAPAPDSEEPAQTYSGRISPLVGRIAAENEVDLNEVTGTGLHGRITKRDILAYVEARETAPPAPPAPAPEAQEPASRPAAQQEPAPAAFDGELLPHSGIRRAIAEHMVRSKQTSPHVTTVFEFDFTAVAAHRAAHKADFAAAGAHLTYTAYIVAATVAALQAHPRANSSWREDGILLHRPIHIGLAVAIDEGLIVPVLKDADGLNLLGLARAINDLAERAREGKLRPDEVRGGTFSITNHGTSGSLFATPIINQPQAGILGIGKIEKRVKVVDDAIAIRPLAYASFTFDHRILDGAGADAFVSAIKERLETWT